MGSCRPELVLANRVLVTLAVLRLQIRVRPWR